MFWFYRYSVLNTKEIGDLLGMALKNLVEKYRHILPRIHLIGHSLGAQICGTAGRYLTRNTVGNLTLPRISGLDPASPCFYDKEHYEEELITLSRNDADWVDLIHSNPGIFGRAAADGHVDFYANGVHEQNGCGIDFICSHNRAWAYYAETVFRGNERNLLASKCSGGRTNLDWTTCKNEPVHPMGYLAKKGAIEEGVYYLKTNSTCPYGLNHSSNSIGSKHFCSIFEKAILSFIGEGINNIKENVKENVIAFKNNIKDFIEKPFKSFWNYTKNKLNLLV